MDPCLSLTAEQRRALGTGDPISAPPSTIAGWNCQWFRSSAEPLGSFYVESSTTIDLADLQAYPPGSPRFLISGFDAVVGRGLATDVSRSCEMFVGVAPGQIIEIAYTYRGHDPTFDHDAACRQARTAAGMVMRTLLARGGG